MTARFSRKIRKPSNRSERGRSQTAPTVGIILNSSTSGGLKLENRDDPGAADKTSPRHPS